MNEIWFTPILGNIIDLPFSVTSIDIEPFRNILERAIRKISEKDAIFLKKSYDISTNSADIFLKPEELDLSSESMQKKYGNAFCLRFGTLFKL